MELTNQTHSDEILKDRLSGFLSQTRLSMNQIADRWNVSSPMLSQIKNGKKKAGIDLGLKILRESGADVNERRSWLESRYFEESKEANLIQKSLQETKFEKDLQKSFCEKMESNPVLVDIVLDITNAEEDGISWNQIFQAYGDYGIAMANELIELGVAKYIDGHYQIVDVNTIHIWDAEAGFNLVSGIIDRMKIQYLKNKPEHKFNFSISDVSKEGLAKLEALHQEFTAKSQKIIDENKNHRINGGFRVISQNLLGLLKSIVFITLIYGWSLDSYAGGFQGGSNGTLPTGKFLMQNSFNYRGDQYEWRTYSIVFRNIPMENRQIAIDAAVNTMDALAMGDASEDFIRKLYRSDSRNMRNSQRKEERCTNYKSRRRVKELLSSGVIKPESFKVSDPVFQQDESGQYKEYYSYNFRVEFPCRLKDRD